MKGLADQVAIVTGAASGIGRELAKQLSASGCHLALLDIDETALKSLWHELDSKRSAISIHRIDIANEDAVNQIVDEAIRIHGRISILINNAAISMSAPFQEVWFEDFRRVIATNLWGAIYLCRYTLPFLSQEKEALIVNVLSGFASLGFPNKTAYCTSKAALLSFSKALYTELYETPVKISVVIPPAVDTNLIRNGVAYDELKKQKEIAFMVKKAMPVEKVARKIISGMLKDRFIIRIGVMPRTVDFIGRWFPAATHNLLATNKSRIDFV